jgi:hypothetical protein
LLQLVDVPAQRIDLGVGAIAELDDDLAEPLVQIKLLSVCHLFEFGPGWKVCQAVLAQDGGEKGRHH